MSSTAVGKHSSPSPRNWRGHIFKAAAFAGVLIAIIILSVESPIYDTGNPPSRLTQVSDAAQAKQIVSGWTAKDPKLPAAERRSLAWDFGLIFCYTTFLILGIRSLPATKERWITTLGAVISVLVVLTAIADVTENILLLRYLNGGEFTSTVWVTRVKFFGFFISLLFLILCAALHPRDESGKSPQAQLVRWVQYVYFLRIPILMTLLFVVLALGDATSPGFSKATRGIFDVENWTELVVGSTMAFLLSWSAMIACRIQVAYGDTRFNVLPPAAIKVRSEVNWWSIAFWALPGCMVIARMVAVAQFSRHTARSLAAAAGAPIALVLLCIADWWRLRERGTDDDPDHAFVFPFGQKVKNSPLVSNRAWFQGIVKWFGEGYWDDIQKRARSGHMLAISMVSLLFAVYGVGGIVLRPSWGHLRWVPVVYFLLLIGALLIWIGAGLSFWLDRFRVPVVISVLTVLTIMNAVRDSDHYYAAQKKSYGETLQTPQEFLSSWLERHKNDHDPLVVVDAAGGGIQASAWTAEVLTKTDSSICGGGRFKNSILLMSSVSGGSVGTMYYADSYITNEAPERVRSLARQSSLREIGWGIAYFDLLRWVPFWPTGHDRASAMEVAWNHYSSREERSEWSGAKHTLGSWSRGVPAVLLNSTVVESGQRFVLGNFRTDGTTYPGLAFQNLYSDCDVRISTAARLSATFPFVSPVARERGCTDPDHPTYHLADGGYYDNFGISSSLEFLKAAGLTREKLDIGNKYGHEHKLLWVLIRAFPDDPTDQLPSVVEGWKAGASWGWGQQVAAPITTMLAVRTSGQKERGNLELRQYLDSIDPGTVPVAFVFVGDNAPLSWHLQRSQKKSIDDGWKRWQVEQPGSALSTVQGQFGCSLAKTQENSREKQAEKNPQR